MWHLTRIETSKVSTIAIQDIREKNIMPEISAVFPVDAIQAMPVAERKEKFRKKERKSKVSRSGEDCQDSHIRI